MRFGITAFESENVISAFKEGKGKGLESFQKFSFSEVVLDAIERGYQHCELSLDIFEILPFPVKEDDLAKLKEYKKKYDITYSAHFPIWSIELCSPNQFIREASIASVLNSFKTFKFLEPDIDVFVLHPSGSWTSDIMYGQLDDKYKKFIGNLLVNFGVGSVKKILNQTKIDPSKIAIENIEFPFDGTLDIINKLKKVKLCIDTAHFLGGFSGKVDLVETVKKYIDITSEIHLMDYNDDHGWDHVALGTGTKLFPVEVLKIINDYGFKGPIIFELTFEQAKKSLEFIRNNAPQIKIPVIKK